MMVSQARFATKAPTAKEGPQGSALQVLIKLLECNPHAPSAQQDIIVNLKALYHLLFA
jgi:hypothetical protein